VSSIGEAWCWGNGGSYQLGDGTDNNVSVPAPQPVANAAFGATVAQISAGGDHSCAVTSTQVLFCWGSNAEGQLGADPGTTPFAFGPVRVGNLFAVRYVEAAGGFTCAVVISVVSCWGANSEGQLGAGVVTPQGGIFDPNTVVLQPGGNGVTIPTIIPLFESAIAIGTTGGCAMATNAENGAPRSVLCWGGGGTLGRMARGIDPGGLAGTAPRGIATRVRFASVAVGNEHACALTPTGEAWCWGQNARGELGDGTTTARPTPVRVTTPVRFAHLALGSDHSCGLSLVGEVWCWGSNSWGQFGDNGSLFQSTVPVQVPTGGAAFTQLASGTEHLCALDAAGALYCWGRNDAGQALAASGSFVGAVTAFTGAQRFSTIAAGARTGCGIEAATGRTWCWGSNDAAQLGRPASFTANPTPELVADAPTATTLSTGGTTCIGTAGGNVWCWGANFGRQVVASDSEFTIPRPTRIDAPVPLFAPRASFTAACALDAAGEPWCWGNSFQAGFDGQVFSNVPRRLVLP
jgi:alpha-tubulin suppressor-like RCC1 family protein